MSDQIPETVDFQVKDEGQYVCSYCHCEFGFAYSPAACPGCGLKCDTHPGVLMAVRNMQRVAKRQDAMINLLRRGAESWHKKKKAEKKKKVRRRR